MTAIKIAGSGPSGLTAAITLARAGYKVHVHEMRLDCGQRFSGDLQGLENWSTKEDVLADFSAKGLEVNFHCAPCSALTVANGTRTETIKTQRPLFYLVKRGSMTDSLDQGLKQQALAAGVKIHFNTKLAPEQADIVATGPFTTKLFGIDKGIVFTTTLHDLAIGLALDDAGYKGYAYLLVTKGYGCLCTVLFDELRRVEQCFEKAKEVFSNVVKLDMTNPHSVGGTGCFVLNNVWERDGQRFVGEAAGLQDFLWGFGIRSAITSGWLAAQSIMTNQSYTTLAQQTFSRRNRAGIVNRYLWEQLGQHDYGIVVRYLGRSRNPFPLLRSFYNFNVLQRLMFPFAKRSILKKYPRLQTP